MERGTVDQWKMWFAGDGPVQYTCLSESHGKGGLLTSGRCGGDGPVQYTCLSE